MAYQPYQTHYGEMERDDKYSRGMDLQEMKNIIVDGIKHAKRYIPSQEDFHELRQQLEGPKPLRVLAGLGGFALAIASALGLVNVFYLLSDPPQFVLQVYEVLFGFLITVIELKAFFKPGNKLKEHCYRWFPFLTVLGGKGAFYLFAGSLGVGFARCNILLFASACYVLAMGVIYILFHFNRCKELREKYDLAAYDQSAVCLTRDATCFDPSPAGV